MVDSIDIPTLFTDKSKIVTYNYDLIDHLIGSEIDPIELSKANRTAERRIPI